MAAATALAAYPPADTLTLRRANLREALDAVARRLGNTRTVTRNCYVHPAIVDSYLDGSLTLRKRRPPTGLTSEEVAVMDFLKAKLKPQRRRRPAAQAAMSANAAATCS